QAWRIAMRSACELEISYSSGECLQKPQENVIKLPPCSSMSFWNGRKIHCHKGISLIVFLCGSRVGFGCPKGRPHDAVPVGDSEPAQYSLLRRPGVEGCYFAEANLV